MNCQKIEQYIRECAYRKWEAAGKPQGNGSEFWYQAEEEILRPYRVLHDEDPIKIWKFNPAKRTLSIARNVFCVQFPYLVFAKRHTLYGDYLYLAFAKENDDRVYFPSVPNVNKQFCVCLNRGLGTGHFLNDSTTMKKLLNKFWLSSFDSLSYSWYYSRDALRNYFGGRFAFWEKMSLDEVLKKLNHPIPFDEFLVKVGTDLSDSRMRGLERF
jgi:hypothetical protein